VPDPRHYDYRSVYPGTNDESIMVLTNSAPVPLTPGAWLIAVVNMEGDPVDYTLVATESTGPGGNLITLTNAVAYTNSISTTNGLDYYQFLVSTTGTNVLFQTLGADGNVDLYLSKGLPLPGPGAYQYGSFNSGNTNELIVVDTNSQPVALTPGRWFLGVLNADVNSVRYAVRATEYGSLYLHVQFDPSGVSHLTWIAVIGADYYIEGKVWLEDPAWSIVSPKLTATDVTLTYTVPANTPYHFFRVVQGDPTVKPLINWQAAVLTTNGFTFDWTGLPQQKFQVQYATNLPPNWVTLSPIITSTTTHFVFTNDPPAGFKVYRFYRVLLVP